MELLCFIGSGQWNGLMSALDLYITHGTKVFNICFSLTYRDEVIFLMLIMDTKIKHLILKPF